MILRDIALSAFIFSFHSVSELVEAVLQNVHYLAEIDELRTAESEWLVWSGDSTLAEDADRVRQKTWDLSLAEVVRYRLIEESDQITRARILASSCKKSGLWLNAYPAPALGTLLDPETFRITVTLRVGAKVCELHPCCCGRLMDSLGLHRLSCKFSAGLYPRNSALHNVVKRSFRSAGVPSVLKPVDVNRGDGKKPDGITVFPFSTSKSLCWDVTCVNTFAEINLKVQRLRNRNGESTQHWRPVLDSSL